ncbi:MAG TPA: hypothetical protein VF086_04095 [Propionibacteriaceae bacterium]
MNEAFLRTDEAGGLGRITKEHIEAFTESQKTAQPEIMTKACK